MELSGTQQLKVYGFHDDPTVSRLADHLAAISGVKVTAEAGSVVEVEASTAAVPAIAALTSVQWVEAKGRLAGLNANARWVNDTGVRDLYNATLPGRLTGAGQTAGVADTAINYTTSANGTANSYFSDCRSGGCVKADYEQVTAGPGTDDANLRNIKANHTNHRKVVAFFDIGAAGPNPPDESSHGTHVSGSVAGDTGTRGTWDRADGMAPGARLVSQNIGTPSGGLGGPTDDYELWRQAYRPRNPGSVPTTYTPSDYANYRPNEDARTHNNSYGLTVPIISLGSAEAADRFVWDHEDMFIVSSAGNSGPDAGSVGAPSIARNVVTSAASANGRQPMVSIDSIASFSSHGPGQSGDFGVDLATPGQIVVSAKGGTNDDEHVLQGTSMSGPLLTGLATLVRQYFFDGYAATGAGSTPTSRRASGIAAGARGTARKTNPSAALVRATMVNGAERMRGYYSGLQGSQRALDGQYPSAGQGFGLVNLRNSLYFDDSQGKSQRSTWFQDVYRGDDTAFDVGATGAAAVRNYTVHVAAGSPLNVTLAFTDAPAALGAGSVAVNNLDLQVIAPNGAVYSGNNFNTETNPGAADYADAHRLGVRPGEPRREGPHPHAGRRQLHDPGAGRDRRDGPAGLRARRVRSAQPGRRPRLHTGRGAAAQRGGRPDDQQRGGHAGVVRPGQGHVRHERADHRAGAGQRRRLQRRLRRQLQPRLRRLQAQRGGPDRVRGHAGEQLRGDIGRVRQQAGARHQTRGARHRALGRRHLQPAAESDRPLGRAGHRIEIPEDDRQPCSPRWPTTSRSTRRRTPIRSIRRSSTAPAGAPPPSSTRASSTRARARSARSCSGSRRRSTRRRSRAPRWSSSRPTT